MTLATWWVQNTPGTRYWRAEIVARHLPGRWVELEERDLSIDEHGEPFFPRQRGAAIWQYPGSGGRGLLMAEMQSQGIPVFVEVDDCYMMPPKHMPYARSDWATRIDRGAKDAGQHSFEAHRKLCEFADGVICATEPLADMYSRLNDNVHVCPNSAELADWSPEWTHDGKVKVGYSGSDSHLYDVRLVDRALRWASDVAEVWKIGLTRVNWVFPHQIAPWADSLEQYRRNLKVLDVGLCPLKSSTWADCKSDIKAIEYTLSGALPIVQHDTPVYADWHSIVPTATTEKDWLKRVKWAVNSPDEVHELWLGALDFVLKNKLITQHIHTWREAIAS